jgi:hypothetical protein
MPSAELKLPADVFAARPQRASARTAAPTGSDALPEGSVAAVGFRDVWYGFYPNGREVLLGIESVQGDNLTAIYAIGPSIDNKHAATWSRRKGRIVEDGFVFEEPGKSTLRFRPRQNGGLSAVWVSVDGRTSMNASLKPIDPSVLGSRRNGESAPITTAAANRDGQEAEK